MCKEIIVDLKPREGQEEFVITEAVFSENGYSGIHLGEAYRIPISAAGGLRSDDRLIIESKLYNEKIHTIFQTDGFTELFLSHDHYLNYSDVLDHFGKEFADYVFSLSFPLGTPQFQVVGDWFLDNNYDFVVSFEAENRSFEYCLNSIQGDAYNREDISFFYEWTDFGVYFSHGLYWKFYEDSFLSDRAEYFSGDITMDWAIDAPEDYRPVAFDACKHIMKTLIDLKYLREYRLITKEAHPIWNNNTQRTDHSVGFAILDNNYKKDKLLVEKINCLLSVLREEDEDDYDEPRPKSYGVLLDEHGDADLDTPFYYLQDEHDQMYISRERGHFGGHKKLKIFGRLDCPSAARYLAKGQYARNRVFFSDEETAVAAGYRPCAVCMPEAYKKWTASSSMK